MDDFNHTPWLDLKGNWGQGGRKDEVELTCLSWLFQEKILKKIHTNGF